MSSLHLWSIILGMIMILYASSSVVGVVDAFIPPPNNHLQSHSQPSRGRPQLQLSPQEKKQLVFEDLTGLDLYEKQRQETRTRTQGYINRPDLGFDLPDNTGHYQDDDYDYMMNNEPLVFDDDELQEEVRHKQQERDRRIAEMDARIRIEEEERQRKKEEKAQKEAKLKAAEEARQKAEEDKLSLESKIQQLKIEMAQMKKQQSSSLLLQDGRKEQQEETILKNSKEAETEEDETQLRKNEEGEDKTSLLEPGGIHHQLKDVKISQKIKKQKASSLLQSSKEKEEEDRLLHDEEEEAQLQTTEEEEEVDENKPSSLEWEVHQLKDEMSQMKKQQDNMVQNLLKIEDILHLVVGMVSSSSDEKYKQTTDQTTTTVPSTTSFFFDENHYTESSNNASTGGFLKTGVTPGKKNTNNRNRYEGNGEETFVIGITK